MTEVTVAISARLEEAANAHGVPISEILERALEQEIWQRISPLDLTPRSRRVIQGAASEAENLGHDYVGTEHLLLGLLAETEGIAAQVLTGLDIASAARERITQIMSRPEYSEDSLQTYHRRMNETCVVAALFAAFSSLFS